MTPPPEIEDELKRSRRRLDLAVEAAGLGFFDYDIRTDEASWSPRTKALYGLPAEAQPRLEEWFETLIHPDDRPMMEAVYAKAVAGDGVFTIEHRAVAPDGSVRWVQVRGLIQSDEDGPRSVLGTVMDVSERRAAEDRLKLTNGELAHRAKNALALMMALVKQIGRDASSVPEFEERLLARISAMARTQDLVTGPSEAVAMGDLLTAALEPFGPDRFDLDPGLGDIKVDGDGAIALALLLHELGTNAVKHGALTTPQGRVRVEQAPPRPGLRVMTWSESGGPRVASPTRSGFGSRLIAAVLRPRGGSAEADWRADGVVVRIEFPAEDR